MEKVRGIANFEFRLLNDFNNLLGEVRQEYIVNALQQKVRRHPAYKGAKSSGPGSRKLRDAVKGVLRGSKTM